MIFADTIILSDLHLGSEVSRAPAALKMLKSASFNRLILLGDIFSDLNFRRLKKEHWQFLGYIRKLSNPKREIEIVWVEGNHDYGLTQVMSHLVGVRVYREYAWEFAGLKHLAMHGHQFDRFVSSNRVVSTFLSGVHLGLQDFVRQETHDRLPGALRYGVFAAFREGRSRSSSARAIKKRASRFLRAHARGVKSVA